MRVRCLVILLLSSFLPTTELLYAANALGTRLAGENMNQERRPSARELATANPDEDFAKAKRAGSIYFLAMRGFTTDVPGVAPEHEYLIRRVGTRVIEGTSDVVGGESGREIRQKSRRYAVRYNQLVVDYLLQRSSKK